MTVPASALWAYGDGFTGLDVVGNAPPDQFGDPQVCVNRVKGRVGDDTTLPPGPWGTRTVQLFVSNEPLAGSTVEAGGLRRPDGMLIPPLTSQTTARLTELSPHETYKDFQSQIHTVYAAAAFNIVPPAGSIRSGNDVAVKILGRSAYVTRIAADCAVTPK